MKTWWISPFLTAALAVPAMAAEGAEAEHVSLFAGSIAQSIAAIIVFLVLLAVLYKAAWGPILKGLQDRENKIRHDLQHAEDDAKQAAATLDEYRKQLADSHQEARRIIEQGRADAQKLAASLQEQAQADIEGARKRAQMEIASAREQAVADLYTYAATLATEVAGKILRREIRPEDQQQLISDALAAIKSGDDKSGQSHNN